MKFFDEDVQLRPTDDADLYPFLVRITQEWRFLSQMQLFEMTDITDNQMSAVTSARDRAVDLFNEKMLELWDKEWMCVFQHHEITDDTFDSHHNVALTAGTKIMVVHRCQGVMAHIETQEKVITSPHGKDVVLFETQEVNLHCAIAPPRDDEFRVLPLSVVPTIRIFEH
ncbi:hypothetical protein KKF64_01820 [Patescibacteria group bacterium]|nr:hypothetical protein [Patescibacteria group bacterium]